jgi:hypothetical protein
MEQNTESSLNLFELQLDSEATGYLGDTARWGKFFSIVGFIFCGLLVLAALLVGTLLSDVFDRMGTNNFPAGIFAIIYLVIAILYFFPCLYLFRFSTNMSRALRNNDQSELNRSFKNLKSCYKYIGILTIIYLGLIILVFIINIVSALIR